LKLAIAGEFYKPGFFHSDTYKGSANQKRAAHYLALIPSKRSLKQLCWTLS